MSSELLDSLEGFKPPFLLNTAVLFMVFNRIDTVEKVFTEIRKAKPPRLYIASDGPRLEILGEAEKVEQVRNISKQVDWPCEVHTLYRDRNLGCKSAISGAINWFFEKEEAGIILEDDCLPSQSFFWYCETMLEKYKNDSRIFLISGYNKQNIWKDEELDYVFSYLGGIWGWATWKRAWKHYDHNMSDVQEFIETNGFERVLGKYVGKKRQNEILSVIKNQISTWAFPWAYTRHKNSAMACVPTKSLIENIGFGLDATHTVYEDTDCVKRHDLLFPIKENKFVIVDREYDELFLSSPSILQRLINKTKRTVRSIFNAE